MEIGAQLSRQRVKHIVSSYQLDGNDTEAFEQNLHLLLDHYPSPLIELALVQTLVDSWLQVPLLRGYAFLAKAYDLLKQWEQAFCQGDSLAQELASTISPEQFQQITGLDPTPIFGCSKLSASQAPLHSSGGGL
ncbi:MAG: hypothetical protein KME42_22510 [Tildeniella nuda ZEHNDER 1965/U140]|jgi:hypothetical protein|nr:hypothetical protein [Tildeniella nuda ZEHNDER 1965/U140]